MRFAEKDNGATVAVTVGKPLTVDLPANPTTGFSWVRVGHEKSQTLGSTDALHLQSTYATEKHAGLMVGVGGMQHITVTPMKSGTYTLQLAYQRAWESAGSAAKTFSLTIQAA